MNIIKTILDKSDYQIYGNFLNIQIDSNFLDEIIDEKYPEKGYKGLIPALLPMESEKESAIVWQRILPENGKKTLCPILMCPDDCDFTCIIIKAEIENKNNKMIYWNKIGINKTNVWQKKSPNKKYKYEPELIGNNVEWFEEIKLMEFSIDDYVNMIQLFKNKLIK
ncbi:MAG: hypothetical protein LBK27_05445 [Treponema sp.]|jgi:hypothetical protein|nr:hypothetical protein [Treponema sp.]